MLGTARTVLVAQPVDLLPVARDLGGLGVGMDGDVGQAFELADQHRIGLELVEEFDQRHMLDHAGKVDRGFDARIAAADHRDLLALEQRAVAMRAIGHALGLVFLFARHIHIAPARARGEDDGAAFQDRAIVQAHAGERARRRRGFERSYALAAHHIHFIDAHMLFERGGEFRAFGLGHRNEVLDRQGVEGLAAETLGDDAGADALACSVNGCSGAGRARAHDQHIERILGAEFGSVARSGAGIDLGEDFGEFHAARREAFLTEEDRGHGHDLARFDLLLEQPAVDRDMAHTRIEHRHQVQRLDHIGAVVAGQAHPGGERKLAVERLDLFDHFGLDLGRMTAGPEDGEQQRSEFMAHGQGGEMHAHVLAGAGDLERRLARELTVEARADLGRRNRGDFGQKFADVGGAGGIIEACDQFDRLGDALEIPGELAFGVVVQHGVLSFGCVVGACAVRPPRQPPAEHPPGVVNEA